jgi:hypothetical protein
VISFKGRLLDDLIPRLVAEAVVSITFRLEAEEDLVMTKELVETTMITKWSATRCNESATLYEALVYARATASVTQGTAMMALGTHKIATYFSRTNLDYSTASAEGFIAHGARLDL